MTSALRNRYRNWASGVILLLCTSIWSPCAADARADLRLWADSSLWYGDSATLGSDGTVEVLRNISDLHGASPDAKTSGLFTQVLAFHAFSWLSGPTINDLLSKNTGVRRVRLTLYYLQRGTAVIAGKFRIERTTFYSEKIKTAVTAQSRDAKTFLSICKQTFDGVWINGAIR